MKTASTRFWINEVRDEFKNKKVPRLDGGVHGLWVDLPWKMKGDIDNRVKLLADILSNGEKNHAFGLGVYADDKGMKALYVEHLRGLARNRCMATVVIMQDWPAYVALRMGS